MAGFKRVFRAFPGYDVLSNIESVNAIEIVPPGRVLGSGSGVVLLVGEFEKGTFSPKRVFGPQDIATTYGGLGHASTVHKYDGAVARKSGGDELWNGNGYLWMRNRSFTGLVICRVDNSAGTVRFRRLATLTGGIGPFVGSAGGTLEFTRDGSTALTATFNGAAATLLAAGASYPVSIAGLTLTIAVDDDADRTVVFTAADTTITNVIDRINGVMGATVASNSSGQLLLTAVRLGRTGSIEVTDGTARTLLGFATTPTAQVSTLTITTAGSGLWEARVTLFVNGVSTNYTATYTAGGGDTAAVIRTALLSGTTGFNSLSVPGVTFVTQSTNQIVATAAANVVFTATVPTIGSGGAASWAATTAAIVTSALGTGNVDDVLLIQTAEAVTVIDAVSGLDSSANSDGYLRVSNAATPATGTLQATGGTLIAAFGFDEDGVTADAAVALDVVIPAGTRVRDTATALTEWVTIEDYATGTGGGNFDVRVRPWVDTDTAIASAATTVTTLMAPGSLPDGFVVSNPSTLTRLSQSQIDVRYQEALNRTLDQNSEAYKANMVASARCSANVNRYLKQNAIDATGAGMAARKAIVRAPIGYTRAQAYASTAAGVGVMRDTRVIYLFPAVVTMVPEIAEIGAAVGGLGFFDDGYIETGADGFYCSVRSILPPEENAGQDLTSTNATGINVLGLEDAYNPEITGGYALTMADYIALKAAGIVAVRIDQDTGACFQSDVTSVDPLVSPALVDASRQFLHDYVQDTMLALAKPYVKKLGTPKRVAAMLSGFRGFLGNLQSANAPDTSRIHSFSVDNLSTSDQFEAGISVVKISVKQHPSMKSINLLVEVGTSVVITDAPA